MNFHIKDPCTEDYSKMTPVEGGVFCKSCEKKVFDLTEKNKSEIKDFFENKSGGTNCVRVSKSDLQELNFDSFFSKFRLWNFRKRIAVIIYLFFGIGIFSGCYDENKNDIDGRNSKNEGVNPNTEQAFNPRKSISVGFAEIHNDTIEKYKESESAGDSEIGFPGDVMERMGWKGKLKEKLPIFEEEKKDTGKYDFVHGFDPDYKYEVSEEDKEKFRKEKLNDSRKKIDYPYLDEIKFDHTNETAEKENVTDERDANGNKISGSTKNIEDSVLISIPRGSWRPHSRRYIPVTQDDYRWSRGNVFRTQGDTSSK